MTTQQQLADSHDIMQIKYRYLRALDTQQWDLMRTCFTPDARAWYAGGRLSSDGGPDGIVKLLSGMITAKLFSSHIAIHPEITFTGPTTATGVWRFQDMVHYSESGQGRGVMLHGAGYYYDEYEKSADGWRIKSTGYERIFEAREDKAANPAFEIVSDPRRGVHHFLAG